MALTPLALGTTANPIVVPTAGEKAALLPCGPLDLSLLNGILKLLGDRVDAVDAADNAIVSAVYNAGTNTLTFTMADGPAVAIPLTPLIADAVATGLIVSSAYNAGTNILALTTANGDVINIDLSTVITDAVSTALAGVISFPTGGIVMWSGAIGAVPAGWALCDGAGGRPDLRDRFIVGAGSTYAVAATGGAATHNHGGTTGGTALTIAQMPAHAHGNSVGDNLTTSWVRGSQAATSSSNMNNDAGAGTNEGITESIGGGDAHTHTVADASSLPPYYALAFIIKL